MSTNNHHSVSRGSKNLFFFFLSQDCVPHTKYGVQLISVRLVALNASHSTIPLSVLPDLSLQYLSHKLHHCVCAEALP